MPSRMKARITKAIRALGYFAYKVNLHRSKGNPDEQVLVIQIGSGDWIEDPRVPKAVHKASKTWNYDGVAIVDAGPAKGCDYFFYRPMPGG